MPSLGHPSPAFRFGVFELDPVSGDLRKHGIRIKLQEQPRQILLLLLKHAGEVVTREEIQKQIWPGDTFVDFDNAINSAVRKLREALGESADTPRFLETLPRRGYRFVAPVAIQASPEPVREPVAPELPALPSPLPPADGASRRFHRFAVIAVLLVSCCAAVTVWSASKNRAATPHEVRLRPLTGNAGIELHPSLSPDGTRVAYSFGPSDGKQFSIYVKLIGPGDPVRLTSDDAARDFSPAWSPDGRWIALLRELGYQAAVLLIPASGGQAREVARVNRSAEGSPRWAAVPSEYGASLAWSRNGKYLFTSGRTGMDEPSAIIRISIETGEQQPLTSTRIVGLTSGDSAPAVSPDGGSIAFVRSQSMNRDDLYVAPLSNTGQLIGDPKRLTADAAEVRAPAWAADGKELIFSSDRAGRREIWRVSASGSAPPVRVVAAGENAYEVAVSSTGRNLVYGRASLSGTISKIPLDGGKAGPPAQIIAASARIRKPQYSPDRSRITFESGRSGGSEVWVCNADGSNMLQLTKFGQGISGSPRWSPDGRYIAFDSNAGGRWAIYVMRSDGGAPIQLTPSAGNIVPNWSHDGRWIYYTAAASKPSQVWKVRPTGSSATQVTSGGGALAVESPDGKYLYYKDRFAITADLWRMTIGAGTTSRVLSQVGGRLVTVTEHGIYFVAGADSATELRFLDFARNAVHLLATMPSGEPPYADVSDDEGAALFARNQFWGTNLMLVENFE